MKLNLITVGLCAATLFACNPNKTSEPSVYEGAKLILNEGAFTGGTATITAFDADTTVAQSFLTENGFPLGNIGQHLIKHDSLLYITLNNGNKVRGISASTMQSKFETTIASPRYLAAAEGKIYVTNWATEYLKVLDDQQGSMVDSIHIHGKSEAVYIDYPIAYVALNGGFQNDHRIAVVDLISKTVDTLNVGDKPNSFAEVSGTLYVLCEGYQDWVGTASTPASLWSISPTSAAEILSAPTTMDHATALRTDGNTLFFLNATYNGALVSVDPNTATSWPTATLTEGVGYSIDILSDTLYVHNAKDFASAGVVYVCDKQGAVLDSIASGVIPRQIIQ